MLRRSAHCNRGGPTVFTPLKDVTQFVAIKRPDLIVIGIHEAVASAAFRKAAAIAEAVELSSLHGVYENRNYHLCFSSGVRQRQQSSLTATSI